MTATTYGFIGLGNMGVPMCGHLCDAGLPIIAYDAAGTAERAPAGAETANDLASVAAAADTIFLSLPDGAVVNDVAGEIALISNRRTTTVVDFSTTGPEAAAAVGASLNEAGMVFVDAPVSGGPNVRVTTSGGLFDVMVDPKYSDNGWIYLTYVKPVGDGSATALARGRLNGNALTELTELFVANNASEESAHWGSRVIMDHDRYLYVTVGDRHVPNDAQDLASHGGKVVRLREDGRVPADNPFVDHDGAGKPRHRGRGRGKGRGAGFTAQAPARTRAGGQRAG